MDNNQNYKTPESDLTPNNLPALYSFQGIIIATVVGSIFAGGLFMSLNFRRMGKRDEASKTLIASIFFSIFVFALIAIIPEDMNIPNAIFIVPQILGMYKAAEFYQKADLEKHQADGGKFESNWAVFGYSLLICAGIFGLIMGAFIVFAI